MKKSMLIAIIAAVLVVAGAIGFVLMQDDDASQNNAEQHSSSEEHSDEPHDHADAAFNALNTEGVDFSATITQGGDEIGTFEQDGENRRYASTVEDQSGEVIYTPDATYSCSAGTCYKLPSSNANSGSFDVESYTYNDERLTQYRNNATHEGQKSCPAGTCDVWKVVDSDVTNEIYIATDSRRISQVVSQTDGETTTVVFDYRDVTINVPENAQDFPSL